MSALTACGAKPAASSSAAASSTATSQPATGEKTAIKFYGKCIEYTSGPMMTDALEKALADKYAIDSIQIDWSNMDTVIRTGIASNDPCDIYNYPASSMANFADTAVDLTPYLDADPEFKAYFSQAALDACTVDGKIVCLPWESNFSVILGNKEAIEAAGVTIPDAWTFEEFTAACEKIKAAGSFPFTNATDLNRGAWIYRNAMLSEATSAGKAADYVAGSLGFDSDESKAALEKTKALYDASYYNFIKMSGESVYE
ncbi:MAG: extracellular solute-binding protein [Clostridia bacterium]|nr:extracellular solute-binding protein [Clostridia bacterium]